MKNNYDETPFILVVDDNSRNLQVVGKILGKKGYKLSLVTSPEKGLKIAKEKKPDLILLDIMLPGIDGYEICEKLKAKTETSDIPVIFLTAKTETDDIVKGFECGAVDYVTKPFNPRELIARVKTHIELKRSREEIKTLRGFIPICAKCKKIRDDEGYWERVEQYIERHSYAKFSHGICPDCIKDDYPDIYDKLGI